MATIAVTGAAGSLGSLVVRLLAQQRAVHVIALGRRPVPVPPGVEVRIADYDDPDALRRGLARVDTLVFISSDGEGTRVFAHHLNVIAAARAGGVGHLVALSGVDADLDSPFCYAITNGLTEQAIRASGCGFSFVRASIFTEFFAHFVRPARTTGELRIPLGDGRVSLVSRVDVGHHLATQAQQAPTGGHVDVTGPEAFDSAALAATAARVWQRPVVDRPISPAEHAATLSLVEEPWWTYAYTSMFAAIRQHRWDRVTPDLLRLTGRRPRTLAEVLAAGDRAAGDRAAGDRAAGDRAAGNRADGATGDG